MSRIAMLTSGPAALPLDDPKLQPYFDLSVKVFDNLTRDDGFLGQSMMNAPREMQWGDWAIPKVYDTPEYAGRVIQTLSLWRDFESLHGFSYNSHHLLALKKSDEWFYKQAWRNHVIWWVEDDHKPTWGEAVNRFNLLREHGNTPDHFDFGHLYDADGNVTKLDRDLLKEKAKLYN